MKKIMKRISVLLLLGAMVFALCGCDALDDMKAHQIFPAEDGSFIIEGVRYVQLETNNYFSPGQTTTEDYYLTEPDVPVLLSQQFTLGRLDITEDGRFYRDWYRDLWFCKEDIFEE